MPEVIGHSVVGRAGTRAYYAVKTAVVERLRRGDRTILWTPQEGVGAGNQLYLWLDAFTRRRSGEDCRVLSALGADEWLEAFPRLRELVIDRNSVVLHDRREGVHDEWLRQRVGTDFSPAELELFITECLIPHLGPQRDMTVVNVRRGDFYGTYLAKYGFDVVGYLAAALPASLGRVVVVSDDPEWCREHLGRVLAGATTIEYAAPGAIRQFQLMASARQLVLTNSTFGYWGGYVVSARGGAVIAPWLHARGINGGAAYQLLPSWTVVQRGPWDAIPVQGA